MGGRIRLLALAAVTAAALACSNPLLDKVQSITAGKDQRISLTIGAAALSAGGSYDFGSAAISRQRDFTVAIKNVGNSTLSLKGAAPVQAGGNFSVPSQPTGSLAPGASTTFVLRFSPVGPEGATSQGVSVLSDDPSQGFYSFTATGFVSTVGLPATGQTTSYSPGDDGATQKGVAWPATRFSAGTYTIVDNLTGLEWAKNGNAMPTIGSFDTDGPNDGLVTWQHAVDFFSTAAGALNYSTGFASQTDWRLPNKEELRSLLSYGQSNVGSWLTTAGFSNVKNSSSDWYWTSTTYGAGTTQAWTVTFNDQSVTNWVKTTLFYVWPVRTAGAGTVALPRTGQTTSRETSALRDDGALQKGPAWPSPRFMNNGDGTVRDKLTGLIWELVPSSSTYLFTAALSHCSGLSLAGHGDWRLPNVNELASLLNAELSDTGASLRAAVPGWTIASVPYWTSTTHATTTSNAWPVSLSDGFLLQDVKATAPYNVIAVRSIP